MPSSQVANSPIIKLEVLRAIKLHRRKTCHLRAPDDSLTWNAVANNVYFHHSANDLVIRLSKTEQQQFYLSVNLHLPPESIFVHPMGYLFHLLALFTLFGLAQKRTSRPDYRP